MSAYLEKDGYLVFCKSDIEFIGAIGDFTQVSGKYLLATCKKDIFDFEKRKGCSSCYNTWIRKIAKIITNDENALFYNTADLIAKIGSSQENILRNIFKH